MGKQKQSELYLNQDRLQQQGPGEQAYLASQRDRGLVAYAWLDTVEHWPKGIFIKNAYMLTCTFEHVSKQKNLGSQEDLGNALADQLRNRVQEAMIDAGWSIVGKTTQGRAIWKHQGQAPATRPAIEHSELGGDDQQSRSSRSRVVYTRPVTFTCQWCHQEVTEQRYPSHTPLYCNKPTCKKEATRVKTRQRVAEWRKAHPDARKKKKV